VSFGGPVSAPPPPSKGQEEPLSLHSQPSGAPVTAATREQPITSPPPSVSAVVRSLHVWTVMVGPASARAVSFPRSANSRFAAAMTRSPGVAGALCGRGRWALCGRTGPCTAA